MGFVSLHEDSLKHIYTPLNAVIEEYDSIECSRVAASCTSLEQRLQSIRASIASEQESLLTLQISFEEFAKLPGFAQFERMMKLEFENRMLVEKNAKRHARQLERKRQRGALDRNERNGVLSEVVSIRANP